MRVRTGQEQSLVSRKLVRTSLALLLSLGLGFTVFASDVSAETGTAQPTALEQQPQDSNFLKASVYIVSGVESDAAFIQVPPQATAARFTFSGSRDYQVVGNEYINNGEWPAANGNHQYIGRLSAEPGGYVVTAEYKVDDEWHDGGTAKLYVLDTPHGSYVVPNSAKSYFKPNDTVAVIRADDEFDQFDYAVVTIDGLNHTLSRSVCDDKGDYVLCGVNDLSLPEGVYTAAAKVFSKAGNESATFTSSNFTIDGSAPVVKTQSDQSISGSSISLQGSASDAVHYVWNQVDGPGTTTFENGASTNTTAKIDVFGTYTYKFTASDEAGNTANSILKVTYSNPLGAGIATDRSSKLTQISMLSSPALSRPASFPSSVSASATGIAGASSVNVLTSGASDLRSQSQSGLISPSNQGWKIFGVAWYWGFLAAAVLLLLYTFVVVRRTRLASRSGGFDDRSAMDPAA